jgi:hypothetical protein
MRPRHDTVIALALLLGPGILAIFVIMLTRPRSLVWILPLSLLFLVLWFLPKRARKESGRELSAKTDP